MRVAICSLTYPLPNGVTNSVNTSIDGLLAAGHEVMIIAPDYGTGSARPEHYPVGSSVVEKTLLHLLSRKERVFSLRARIQIRDLLAQFDPDIFWLHSVTYAKNAFERAMVNSGKPSLVTYHTHLDMYGRIYGGIVGEQMMIRRSAEVCNAADAVITPTLLMEKRLREFGVSAPIYVIPTGINRIVGGYTSAELHQKLQVPRDNKILLSVGRVVAEKNIFVLFRMMAELVKSDPKVTLVMIGPGDISAARQEVKKLKISHNVIFTGQMTPGETKKCYVGADLFVFASTTETQGLVVGEAMTVGLPVVALTSDVQAEVYPETVASIAKTDAGLAPKVQELLNDPAAAKVLGQKGKKFVEENFGVERMIERQLAVLESLVKEKVQLAATD